MSFKSPRKVLIAVLLVVTGVFIGIQAQDLIGADDTYEQLKKLENAFLLIDRQYVEDVSPSELAESAIQAMLEDLDPHSTYIDAESIRRVQEQYEGSFGGIGVWFEAPASDTARVTSTVPDGPSDTVGVRAGDRMIAVNGEEIIGLPSLEMQNRLKGQPGTTVELTVARRGVTEPLTFVITRQVIPLYSVDASYMLDDKTGYLRIGRFAMTTHDEFVEHVTALKAQGLERLILDLRQNPGGIKNAAVQIADEMLDGTGTIVFTRGRNPQENEIDRVTPGGILTEEPVIVLVDANSASGSEIVAGALQDHDRALIVGRRTFGKGLVQRPFQLPDNSVLQITVARYFMPSGRLIQTPYEDGNAADYYETKFSDYELAVMNPEEYLDHIPDSLRFETLHGRTVYGGGGVMPDVIIPPDSTLILNSKLVQSLLQNAVMATFMRNEFDAAETKIRERWDGNRDEFLESFEITENQWARFVEYAGEQGFSFSATKADAAEKMYPQSNLNESRDVLEVLLKARMSQRLYRSEAWYPVFNGIDPVIEEALDLWLSADELVALYQSHQGSSSGNGF
jgi:carboxyl-terminal processing protease